MKRIIFIILLLPIAYNYFAQNWMNVTSQYIKNPSFEEYIACPQSNSSYPSSMWIDSVAGWYAPTQGTSDYMNSCNTNNLNSVPNNTAAGFQYAFDGVAYCGFLAYSIWNNSMWSEYIQTKLLKPLKQGIGYKFSMRINRADGYNLAVQNIGASFSKNTNINNTTLPYNLIPTVLNSTGFLIDTLNWTLVSGEFIANGGENYLTIGWFGDTISSDFLFFIPPEVDTVSGDSLYLTDTYYLIDSVNLWESTFDINNVNIITPNEDGINDYFDFSIYNLKKLSFTVFNRWGNEVFSSIDTQLKWNGKNNNNQKLSAGTYFYLLKATTSSGDHIYKHNSITIFY